MCWSQNLMMSDSRRSLASSTAASRLTLELDLLDLDLLLDLPDLERDLVLDRLLRLPSEGDLDSERERERAPL